MDNHSQSLNVFDPLWVRMITRTLNLQADIPEVNCLDAVLVWLVL